MLWAGVITFASTDAFSSANTDSVLAPIVRWVYPTISSEHLEAIHLFVRKAAHFAEYFIFYVLLYRGIRGRRTGWRWSWGITA
jgi:VanZ family protein